MKTLPYRPCAKAYIRRRNSFLLVQLQSYSIDQWKMPGGGIESGETPLQAAYREILEEVGLVAKNLELIGHSKIVYKYDFPLTNPLRSSAQFQGQLVQQFGFNLVGEQTGLRLQDEEIGDAKWVELQDLEKYLLFPKQYSNARRVIQELW